MLFKCMLWLQGLAQVHKRGICHRDLKPANMMWTGQGSKQKLVILDFGVAAYLNSKGQHCGILSMFLQGQTAAVMLKLNPCCL